MLLPLIVAIIVAIAHWRQNVPHAQTALMELLHPIDGRAGREGIVGGHGRILVVTNAAVLVVGVVAIIIISSIIAVAVVPERKVGYGEFLFQLVDRFFELSVLQPDLLEFLVLQAAVVGIVGVVPIHGIHAVMVVGSHHDVIHNMNIHIGRALDIGRDRATNHATIAVLLGFGQVGNRQGLEGKFFVRRIGTMEARAEGTPVLRGIPVVVILPDGHGGLAIGVIAQAAVGRPADLEAYQLPVGPAFAAAGGGKGLGFLLGLPDGNVPAVAFHVQGGVVVKDGHLGRVDGLPLVGDRPGEVSETDLSVGLAVPPGFRRVCDDALDGRNGLLGTPLAEESLDDPGPGVLEENVVGAQGPLGFVLGLLPRPAFRRGLAFGSALGRILGARAPVRSLRIGGFVGVSSGDAFSGFGTTCDTVVARLLRGVAAAFLHSHFDGAAIVQAGPFFGDRPGVAGFVENITVTRSLFLEYVDVDGSVVFVDGLGNGNGMRHLCLNHSSNVALAKFC